MGQLTSKKDKSLWLLIMKKLHDGFFSLYLVTINEKQQKFQI